MATASTDFSFKDGHGCPICLDGFTSPRQLPCLHSFCEHCLQDYLTKKATCSIDKTFEEFVCPVCRAVTRPANKEKPVEEWASLFPDSPFPLLGKSKFERSCEVCWNSSDGSINLAKKFCVVCEEFMCDKCSVYHQNMKISKSHQIITTEDLENKPEDRVRFREGFGCLEHDNEDIRFYCRSHKTACCGTCPFLHHKACEDVLELKQNLPGLLKEMNPQKIREQMHKLEDHLKNFMETNEVNLHTVESYINNLSSEIGDIRRKLNTVLDDIEKMVKLEGNRIYKEWLIRKQEQNHQCQSLVSAIRNSQELLEMVSQYGSDAQKFLVTSKMAKQLSCYIDLIQEKFERVDNIRIRLELNSNVEAILSQDPRALVKIACQEEGKDLQCISLMMPLQMQTVELLRVNDVHNPSGKKIPAYLSIVQLPEGYILLADWNNSICCLYDSTYNLITSHTLLGNPYDMCLIEDKEVAVTVPHMKTVQFLSIKDHSICDIGTVISKHICRGVAAVSNEEFLVSGFCDDKGGINKCYWSLISRNGNVKLHHEFDCQRRDHVYVALDMSKSHVYISLGGDNAVYCFGLTDGKQYFVYLSSNLKSPLSVAVDREDNVYVVGFSSNNIHKLSSDGVTLQVISTGVPERPRGISFSQSRDHFCITNEGPMRCKLHHFVHKYISRKTPI